MTCSASRSAVVTRMLVTFAVLAGWSSVATAQDGEIVAWGRDVEGQCVVPPPNMGFVSATGGYGHTLALKNDGSIVAWGLNNWDQCVVPEPNTGFIAVARGWYFSLGLRSDGTIEAWGSNSDGQCEVPPDTDFIAVAGGGYHSLGLKSDGSIVVWGRSDYGLYNVPDPNEDFVAIAGGGNNCLGLKNDGRIMGWGLNGDGECDPTPPNEDYVAVAAGNYHGLGLRNDGSIEAWGNNDDGQCNVPEPNTDFVAIAAGNYHSLGLKNDGSIVAWGQNVEDQCIVPEPNTLYFAVGAGFRHSLGLRFIDCNEDGIADEIQMAECQGELWCGDCDGNGIMDACDPDTYPEGDPDGVIDACDCNDNGILDACDIDCGSPGGGCDVQGCGQSDDRNLNDVPDECDPDYEGDMYWISPDGGLFGSFLNWDPDTPGPDNAAVFDLDAQYTVDFFHPWGYEYENYQLKVSAGDLTFDLAGSTYTLNATGDTAIVVGEFTGDDAHLTIANGALEGSTGMIAQDGDSAGAITITGSNASWLLDSDLIVGWEGTGDLVIEQGANVQCLDGALGARPGSSALALVTGADSRWDALFSLRIDNGALIVEDGATVSASFGSIFIYQNGRLSGDGTIEGEVVNFGDLLPGASPGTLRIEGDYRQVGLEPGFGQVSGTLILDVAGPEPGLEHDVLDVAGTAELGGGLFVDLVDEYVPQPEDTFEILTAASRIGQFDVALLPGISDDYYMNMVYGRGARGDGLTLTIEDLEDFFLDPLLPEGIGGRPSDVALGCFNDDPYPDLAVTLPAESQEEEGYLLVLLNGGIDPGTGQWKGFSGGAIWKKVGKAPSSVAVGDFDDDGHLDAVVSNEGDDNIIVLYNDGAGGFGASLVIDLGAGAAPSAVAAANFDNDEDGLIDLAVVNAGDDNVMIFLNTGGRGFVHHDTIDVGVGPGVLEPEDLDDDTNIDFIVVNRAEGTISIAYNAGGGTFEPAISIPVQGSPVDVRSGDFDNNSHADIIVTNRGGGTVSLILNDGGREFRPAVHLPVGDEPRSITAVDLEPDNDLDIALVADVDGVPVVQVLRNDLNEGEQLIFAEAEAIDLGGALVFVTSDDVDDDGDEDVVAVDEGAGPARPGDPWPPRRGDEGNVSVLLNGLPCPADLDDDGDVDTADLLFLLGAWGTPDGDVDGDGDTDTADLLALLGAWGECP